MKRTDIKRTDMKIKRKAAFSFVELLISMFVVSLLGGIALTVLWMAFNMFSQTDDYSAARQEIEFVAQTIGREITNIGLGMPNNKQERGSFAASFHADTLANSPIMAQMGRANAEWGGPVTLGKSNSADEYTDAFKVTTTENIDGRQLYHGPELFYAWGIPTGVKVDMNQKRLLVVSADHGFELLLKVHPFSATQTGLQRLQNFQYDLRNIGITTSGASGGKNPSSWILFPSLMLPLLVKTIVSPDVLSVDVAPSSPINLKGISVGFEEVHLLQVARVYLDTQSGELVQLIFGSDFTDATKNTRKVLARNIVGLYFSFDPEMRLLTMYVAARGSDSYPVVRTEQPAGWPSFAPPLSHDARRYRILVNTLIWRIRN